MGDLGYPCFMAVLLLSGIKIVIDVMMSQRTHLQRDLEHPCFIINAELIPVMVGSHR